MSGHCKKCGYDGCVCDINQFHADLPKEQYEQGFMSETPRTDKIRDKISNNRADLDDALNLSEEIETELTAAREELAGLKFLAISSATEAGELRDQRDRLAEAGEKIIKHLNSTDEMMKVYSIRLMREALQSLNQNEKPLA